MGGIGWNLRTSGVNRVLWVLSRLIYTSFWYNFETVLYQFLETGTLDRTLTGLDQLLKCSSFNLYPLSFFLYSPFTWIIKKNIDFQYKEYQYFQIWLESFNKYCSHVKYIDFRILKISFFKYQFIRKYYKYDILRSIEKLLFW